MPTGQHAAGRRAAAHTDASPRGERVDRGRTWRRFLSASTPAGPRRTAQGRVGEPANRSAIRPSRKRVEADGQRCSSPSIVAVPSVSIADVLAVARRAARRVHSRAASARRRRSRPAVSEVRASTSALDAVVDAGDRRRRPARATRCRRRAVARSASFRAAGVERALAALGSQPRARASSAAVVAVHVVPVRASAASGTTALARADTPDVIDLRRRARSSAPGCGRRRSAERRASCDAASAERRRPATRDRVARVAKPSALDAPSASRAERRTRRSGPRSRD